MSSGRDLSKFTGSLASQFAESESMRLARMVRGTDLFGRSVTEEILRQQKLADPFIEHGTTSRALREAIEGTRLFDRKTGLDAYLGGATASEEARKQIFGSFGGTISDVLRVLRDQPDLGGLASAQLKMLERDSALFGTFSRATRWSDAFIGQGSDYSAILGGGRTARDEFDAVRDVAGGLKAAHDHLFGEMPSGPIDRIPGITATKLSLFAGAIDVLGPASSSSQAALHAILGDYSAATAPIHRSYWSRPDERARYYREHNVDEGLVDAETEATVTALVETGVVEGTLSRRGSVTAIIEIGGVRMEISASRAKSGARDAIDAFENQLRRFIETHLAKEAGDKWFIQRVPGEIVARAKEKRREAVRAGETQLTLIHYLDLGELLTILQRADNWKIFGAIFDRKEWLNADIERLNALRRPAMHSRPIDAVQLVEVVTTIRRLAGWMERDPDWLSGWDDDI
ncbi:Swt1 family HEPN domain-containing protein [Sphingopyxis terrae]|uniref:Swt1-like HEPN domain-containing protein n=1 Tax=Sphingopyxis terrae subsp. ummariensis TaxID=429001 RepID=A0A1Y6FQ70_9SPHN|nr:Swt1 family HEPN domain-containing protein [Sphingopyxis terrae]PCF90995.1 hypothetical protein CPA46_11080 [Sphingopyxis terrae subsp. ummariensis]SMQ76386.1 hypothetical protein SAMN06295984_1827 [Sphingopyxis terrae subsp. ummariensis]